jgi:hypothetical protein
MVWVNARSVATEMIYLESCWDRTVRRDVSRSMRAHVPPLEPAPTVTVAPDITRPLDASVHLGFHHVPRLALAVATVELVPDREVTAKRRKLPLFAAVDVPQVFGVLTFELFLPALPQRSVNVRTEAR